MDITNPLSILLQQGTGYVLFVLACFVIWWQQRQREKDKQELLQSFDSRRNDVVTIGNAYNTAMNANTSTIKDMTIQNEKVAAAVMDISKSVAQLTYREGK